MTLPLHDEPPLWPEILTFYLVHFSGSRSGIVIKIPFIHAWIAVRDILCCWRRGYYNFIKAMWSFPVEAHASPKGLLFGGIVANWKEYTFYQKTHNIFCQPTYFSLFGFINIQRLDEPCLIDCTDLWSQLHFLTKGKVWVDSHHFMNPDNFCFYNGQLRMLDYGSEGSRVVVEECGAEIVRLFDPAYSWEEEKRKLEASYTQEVS